ncbi:alpha/beta fold hydrolase [Mucilaginibacter paludis]|uniref:Alpha/beta hydrolase fold containing protein n=1 Tax=Mucilaginibacter paludis DSM 18603 TaxID=714943 RepID=H1YAW1_9SPHI|nr:alpha/beta hydrolase [Mucilaginibacter paludis]EHQ29570.1 alpha/beta hydrolase fold containing protein [Mucilaginibacter paludis DSM 18603]
MDIDVLKRNNVKVFGEGQNAIIFAHGYGADQNAWRYIYEAFAPDYKVVLFDFVGSGQSDQSAYDKAKYHNLNGYASDVLDIAEALNLKDAIFVGHCVSSMVGMLASLEKPGLFKKLVFLGPSACYINDGDYAGGLNPAELDSLFDVMDNNYQGWARAMAPAVIGNPDRPELGEGYTADWIIYDPEVARNFARATFLSDNRRFLPHVNVPSLSLICDEDILATPAAVKYINENTPENTVKELDASGHCPHLSAPVEVIKAIREYIQN